MKKYECTVCHYVYTGDEPPKEACPICRAQPEKFKEIEE
jgi:rubredoxin